MRLVIDKIEEERQAFIAMTNHVPNHIVIGERAASKLIAEIREDYVIGPAIAVNNKQLETVTVKGMTVSITHFQADTDYVRCALLARPLTSRF